MMIIFIKNVRRSTPVIIFTDVYTMNKAYRPRICWLTITKIFRKYHNYHNAHLAYKDLVYRMPKVKLIIIRVIELLKDYVYT